MTQDQIVTRITNGSANMPAYTRILRPDEVQTLAEVPRPAAVAVPTFRRPRLSKSERSGGGCRSDPVAHSARTTP